MRRPRRGVRSNGLLLIALANQGIALAAQFLAARRFGVSGVVDAWMAAQALPAVAVALTTALASQLALPLLAEARERGGEPALRRTAGELLTLLGSLGLLASLGLAAARAGAVGLVAPGLGPAERAEAEIFLLLLAPGLAPAALNLVLAQVAQLEGRFLWIALIGPLTSLAQVVAFLVAPEARALHWMLAAQAATSFLALPLSAWIAAPRRRIAPAAPSRTSIDLLRRSLPVLCIIASSRINQAVDTFFASSLEEGSVAALGYAHRGVAIVLAVLAAPVASLVFARLASEAARENWPAFAGSAARSTERALFLSVGAAMLLVALGRPAAALLLGLEADAPQAVTLGACFAALSGIAAFGVWGSLLTRICLAARRMGPALLFLGIVPIALNALLDALLVGPFGVVGLAAVTSLNAVIGLPIMHGLLRRQGLVDGPLYGPLARFALCALPPSAALLALPPAPAGAVLWQAGAVGALALAAAASYVALVHLSGGRPGALLRGD